jgi:hypothetical protein
MEDGRRSAPVEKGACSRRQGHLHDLGVMPCANLSGNLPEGARAPQVR